MFHKLVSGYPASYMSCVAMFSQYRWQNMASLRAKLSTFNTLYSWNVLMHKERIVLLRLWATVRVILWANYFTTWFQFAGSSNSQVAVAFDSDSETPKWKKNTVYNSDSWWPLGFLYLERVQVGLLSLLGSQYTRLFHSLFIALCLNLPRNGCHCFSSHLILKRMLWQIY